MKILFANYRLPYPVYVSGADVANHCLLKHLQRRGHEIETLFSSLGIAISSISDKLAQHSIESQRIANSLRFRHDELHLTICTNNFFEEYKSLTNSFNPDIILMANPFKPVDEHAFFVSSHAKYVYILHSLKALEYFAGNKNAFHSMITVSEYMQSMIRKQWQKESSIVYPIPEKGCLYRFRI